MQSWRVMQQLIRYIYILNFLMKAKNFSFAEVLKNRSKSSSITHSSGNKLSDLLQQYARHPQGNYTIYLKQKNKNSRMDLKVNESREDVFDSWIKEQSSLADKENIGLQPKNKSKSTLFLKNNDFSQERQTFKERKDPNLNNSSLKSDKMYKNTKEVLHLRSQFSKITKQKLLQINNLFSTQEIRLQQSPQTSKFQQLIASTENIHLQIANLAKKYAKQKKIEQDQPLLLSSQNNPQNHRRIQDAKNAVNQLFDKINNKEKIQQQAQNQIKPFSNQTEKFPHQISYSFAIGFPLQAPEIPFQISQNQNIDQISDISSQPASQKISDSSNFDFVKHGVGGYGNKFNLTLGGFNKEKVTLMIENLKQEFQNLKIDQF